MVHVPRARTLVHAVEPGEGEPTLRLGAQVGGDAPVAAELRPSLAAETRAALTPEPASLASRVGVFSTRGSLGLLALCVVDVFIVRVDVFIVIAGVDDVWLLTTLFHRHPAALRGGIRAAAAARHAARGAHELVDHHLLHGRLFLRGGTRVGAVLGGVDRGGGEVQHVDLTVGVVEDQRGAVGGDVRVGHDAANLATLGELRLGPRRAHLATLLALQEDVLVLAGGVGHGDDLRVVPRRIRFDKLHVAIADGALVLSHLLETCAELLEERGEEDLSANHERGVESILGQRELPELLERREDLLLGGVPELAGERDGNLVRRLGEDGADEALLVTRGCVVDGELVEAAADARDAVLSVDGDLHDVHAARVGELALVLSILVHHPHVGHAAVVGDEKDLVRKRRGGDGRPRASFAPRLRGQQGGLVVPVAPPPQPALLAAFVALGSGGLAERVKHVAPVRCVLRTARCPGEGEHGHLARVRVHRRELREARRGEEGGDDEDLAVGGPPLQLHRRAAVAHALRDAPRDGQREHLVPVHGLRQERDHGPVLVELGQRLDGIGRRDSSRGAAALLGVPDVPFRHKHQRVAAEVRVPKVPHLLLPRHVRDGPVEVFEQFRVLGAELGGWRVDLGPRIHGAFDHGIDHVHHAAAAAVRVVVRAVRGVSIGVGITALGGFIRAFLVGL